MIKKTKDAANIISNGIQNALEYNLNLVDGETPIKMSSFEISRGLLNAINKDEAFMADVYANLLLAFGECFTYKTQDNEDLGCYLYIYYKL